MCMDCGCGVAHGEASKAHTHLVVEDLKEMARSDKTSLDQVLANIEKAAQEDKRLHPEEWRQPLAR